MKLQETDNEGSGHNGHSTREGKGGLIEAGVSVKTRIVQRRQIKNILFEHVNMISPYNSV